MIRGHRIVALVPARGGSKGIPRKNLYQLQGVPLTEGAVRLARACKTVDTVLVSTDDAETFALAQSLGASTPVPRPPALASDTARTIDVVRNLVEEGVIDAEGCLLLLQPTTPLRSLADLDVAVAVLNREWDEADAVVSVCTIDGAHPFKAQVVKGGFLSPLMGHDAAVPRQSLPETFLPNGALYLAKTAVLLAEDTFMPRRTLPHLMSAIASINLDGPLDLLLLEAVVKQGLAKFPGATPP